MSCICSPGTVSWNLSSFTLLFLFPSYCLSAFSGLIHDSPNIFSKLLFLFMLLKFSSFPLIFSPPYFPSDIQCKPDACADATHKKLYLCTYGDNRWNNNITSAEESCVACPLNISKQWIIQATITTTNAKTWCRAVGAKWKNSRCIDGEREKRTNGLSNASQPSCRLSLRRLHNSSFSVGINESKLCFTRLKKSPAVKVARCRHGMISKQICFMFIDLRVNLWGQQEWSFSKKLVFSWLPYFCNNRNFVAEFK